MLHNPTQSPVESSGSKNQNKTQQPTGLNGSQGLPALASPLNNPPSLTEGALRSPPLSLLPRSELHMTDSQTPTCFKMAAFLLV